MISESLSTVANPSILKTGGIPNSRHNSVHALLVECIKDNHARLPATLVGKADRKELVLGRGLKEVPSVAEIRKTRTFMVVEYD